MNSYLYTVLWQGANLNYLSHQSLKMWHCCPLNFTKLFTGEEKENDANRRKENP
jgi:hypothetical protein